MTESRRSLGAAPAVQRLGAALALWLACVGAGRAAVSTDTGLPADGFAAVLAGSPRGWWDGGWVRLRDISGLPAAAPADDARFQGLAALRRAGVKPLVFFAPATGGWQQGLRETGGKKSLPLDLGEAFVLAERLAADAWPNVAAWEIGNEPDLFWTNDLAATHAAYLKAVALGLRAGARAAREAAGRGDRRVSVRTDEPLILNGALAMTPGPFLEQFAANDALSYLDGLNWHFYGYAEDFTAQHAQFEAAVTELAAARARAAGRAETRTLPVFLTEFGYGLLSGESAQTTKGRVRQWRWFNDVGGQMRALGVAGPVAFYLPPYLEDGKRELGLTMAPVARPTANGSGENFSAGGVSFTAADFGAARPEPWMRGIGARVGGNEASPALAWLASQPTSRARGWRVALAPPSPVVLDFVPDRSIDTLKSWHGLLLKSGTGRERTGGGELRIYNFSDRAVTGRLTARAAAGLETTFAEPGSGAITLAPFALVKVPVGFRLTADALRAFAWEAVFTEDAGRVPPAVYATQFYPNAGGGSPMAKETAFRFNHPVEAAAGNRALLLARPLAREEPRLRPQGRWLASDGLAIEETEDGWRFTVTALPAEPMRPAMAELPLPDGWRFPDGHLLMFQHRLVAPPAGMAALRMDCLFRTANGNLFEVMPPPDARDGLPQVFAQAKENFTGMSYGRMNPPWRFAENRPAALVFFFRPDRLPATFEVRGAEVARLVVRQEAGAR